MHVSRLVCIIYVGILMFYITLSIHNACNHEYSVWGRYTGDILRI